MPGRVPAGLGAGGERFEGGALGHVVPVLPVLPGCVVGAEVPPVPSALLGGCVVGVAGVGLAGVVVVGWAGLVWVTGGVPVDGAAPGAAARLGAVGRRLAGSTRGPRWRRRAALIARRLSRRVRRA